MLLHLLRGPLLLALVAVLAAQLTPRIGPGAAAGAVAFVGGVGSLVGALLVRSSPVGQLTWRNRAAGWLMPLGGVFGPGSLARIAGTSAALVAVAGAVGAYGARTPWLTLALGLDLLALLLLVRAAAQHGAGSGGRRRLALPMGLILVAASVGVGLHCAGHQRLGALVAGGALLVGGVVFGSFALVMVTLGRNARWN